MDPRATRRPIAGLSHNHADPDPRTNDRGETTLGPPTQFDHWTLYLNAAQANLKFPSQFFAGLVQSPSPATAPSGSCARFVAITPLLYCNMPIAVGRTSCLAAAYLFR